MSKQHAGGGLVRIGLADPFADPEVVRTALGDALPGAEIQLEQVAAIPQGPGIVALLVGPEVPMTAEDLALLPDLRVIAVTSAGSDHVPVEAARAAGIWVTSSAGYCTEEVADHTLALGVGLLRGTVDMDRDVRRGIWDVEQVRPRRIAGTRWGLVGFGRIARAVAERAAALSMPVSAWAPKVAQEHFEKAGVRRVENLVDLLAGTDLVSLHVPLTAETANLIGAAELAAMPLGSFLVNVSRGEILDHDALAAALDSGRLKGAALDTLPTEPPRADDPALSMKSTVLNPHAAWYSPEAHARAHSWAGAAVGAVLSGRQPDGLVIVDGRGPMPRS
ncbi:NAD(P)-dependent oxidoreductase [Streptomyces sp. HUAS ZL42]|uniref:NAD(P)-dependent oxidoreductase n=1 Tax=Streptomyces sp. HUAS ZL42 TaxID=3231715 RepID=UPI00345E2EFC